MELEVSFIIILLWLDVDYVWCYFYMVGGDDVLEWKIGLFVVLWKIFYCWFIVVVFKFLKNIYKGDLKNKNKFIFYV